MSAVRFTDWAGRIHESVCHDGNSLQVDLRCAIRMLADPAENVEDLTQSSG